MTAPRRAWRRLARVLTVTGFAAVVMAVVWFRSAPITASGSQDIAFRPITAPRDAIRSLAPFEVAGAWQLTGDPALVTGLSGLDVLPDGRLLAVGDRGSRVVIAPPAWVGSGPRHQVGKLDKPPELPVDTADSESVTVDPATGAYWTAMETDNRVVFYAADGSRQADADPAAMERWPKNVGPEAMARLADGRFLILGEMRERGRDRTFPMLLFSGDPVKGAEPVHAHLAMPGDYKPVGAAVLPDGRVLVLGRDLRFPFRFFSLIALIDPRRIKPAALVRAQAVATITGGALSDNYEGIAAAPAAAGQIRVWLVSDDNQQQILQSTKLLELTADPAAL